MARLEHRKENGEASTVPLLHQSLNKCGSHQEFDPINILFSCSLAFLSTSSAD